MDLDTGKTIISCHILGDRLMSLVRFCECNPLNVYDLLAGDIRVAMIYIYIYMMHTFQMLCFLPDISMKTVSTILDDP